MMMSFQFVIDHHKSSYERRVSDLSSVWCFFFFKQKTAYEMRISDWSSDVCSSDLTHPDSFLCDPLCVLRVLCGDFITTEDAGEHGRKIGRASCRERVCQYV